MMNRRQRRAAAAQGIAPADQSERTTVIRNTCHYLAHIAAPTATGATVFLLNGERLYISVETARAMAGKAPGRGPA